MLALLEREPESQLGALGYVSGTPAGALRVTKLLRLLAEEPACFNALNTHVRGRIHALAGPLSFLLRRPAVLDTRNKRAWLQRRG